MAEAPSSDVTAHRVRTGLTRAALSNHLSEVLDLFGINCVLDVGANHGQHGMILRGLGYEGLIVSVEPVAEAFATLERAMAQEPPWVGHRLALGETNETAEINVYANSDLSSLVEPTPYARELLPELWEPRREQVEVRRLDDLFDEWVQGADAPRVMLKIDAQGTEWQVLTGATDSLDRVLAVQVECAVKPIYEGVRPFVDVLGRLNDAGFELSGLFPVALDPQLRMLEVDCVMVRSAAAN